MNVNLKIALTHVRTRKKQTLIAALGVTIGIALYIFSNSLMKGFSDYSRKEMFKTIPHVRVFGEDQMSQPIGSNGNIETIIANPQMVSKSKSLNNPNQMITSFEKLPFVQSVAPQVNIELFFHNGSTSLRGTSSGIKVEEANKMFDIESTMIGGRLSDLSHNQNGIIIGKGIAEKLNLGINDNLSITSSVGINKVLKVIGVFSIGNKVTDESKSYINMSLAQQLISQSPSFVTDIYINVSQPDSSKIYAEEIAKLTDFKVEDWQTTNADMLATDSIRDMMNGIVAFAIMMVAAFGIYNILNMTITQKMNDIAILKANGFKGKDIIKIFVTEAAVMGVIGTILGLSAGAILIEILSKVYVGPPIGYFPITYKGNIFFVGALFGMITSIGAGYFPARRASKLDPVTIFRK